MSEPRWGEEGTRVGERPGVGVGPKEEERTAQQRRQKLENGTWNSSWLMKDANTGRERTGEHNQVLNENWILLWLPNLQHGEINSGVMCMCARADTRPTFHRLKRAKRNHPNSNEHPFCTEKPQSFGETGNSKPGREKAGSVPCGCFPSLISSKPVLQVMAVSAEVCHRTGP